MAGVYYHKEIEDITELTIRDDWVAIMKMDELPTATVKLTGKEEADKLIKEFEDEEGELCYEDDAIMEKYTELQVFRP